MLRFWLLPKDNHDEEKDVEPEFGKTELLFKANTTEHFSDIDEMSPLFVSLRFFKYVSFKKQQYTSTNMDREKERESYSIA